MPELRYNIGLDFGTYQSKACVFHTSVNPPKHEFLRFTTSLGNQSFFLPSRVYLRHNDTFDYGFSPDGAIKAMFTYFKIASAEDEHFRMMTGLKRYQFVYGREEFGGFSPELLSVLYITYLLMTIKDGIRQNKGLQSRTGLFGGSSSLQPIQVAFTTQLGIPTEYSKSVNQMRRRKFENILLVSEMLQKSIPDLVTFKSLTVDQVLDLVKECLSSINNSAKTVDAFNSLLNDFGVSVYPEAAAGLTFLLKTKRLEPGQYVALDVGGGSSDLSFFTVTQNNRIRYLASEAFMVAANDMYRRFSGKESPSFADLQTAEKEMLAIAELDDWYKHKSYEDAVEDVSSRLSKCLYLIFNKRVYWCFARLRGTKAFKNQPCFFFGGGARLPGWPRYICIHDNGQPNNLKLHTYVRRTNINKYLPSDGILPSDDSWRKDFGLLVVAFGLSYPHSENETYWDLSDYTDYSRGLEKAPKLVAHPFNEDMYVYDVVEARWRQ